MGDRDDNQSSESSSPHNSMASAQEFLDGAYTEWDLSFGKIVESINDGVLVCRLDGEIIYANPNIANILGYTPDELIGETVFEFMTDKWADEIRLHLQRRSEGIEEAYDHQVRHRDGSPVWIHVSAKPLCDDGEPKGSLVAVQNITKRKQVEQKLREARDRARESSKAKGDFLANMSHEIRTPMNGVLGMLELLDSPELRDQQREYVRIAREAADGLLQLIDDILDFSKIEARELELQQAHFSPGETLGATLQTLARQAEKKDLDLVYHFDDQLPPRLIGDPDRLRQVLINLVKNSIKATDDGHIAVVVTVDERQEDSIVLHFAISDTGRGIPEDEQERIFEAFHQADSSMSVQHSGTGLGLTIASQLVQLMDGDIWLESEPGEGTTFHFSATFGVDTQEVQTRPENIRSLEGVAVLAIDDNPINRQFLEALLSSWNMKPTTVEDGDHALDSLRKAREQGAPFELVLLEYELYDIDGLELAEAIRDAQQDLAVVLLSSSGMAPTTEEMNRAGIDNLVRKPIRPSALLDAIIATLHLDDKSSEPTPSKSAKKRALRILLAEDNPVNQRVTIGLLEKRNHDVVLATNGQAVVDTLREDPDFDLVLMDIQMPEVDGYRATSMIRELEKDSGEHIPIIALTAHAMAGDREKMLDAGMDDYLAKPVTAEELYDKVESCAE